MIGEDAGEVVMREHAGEVVMGGAAGERWSERTQVSLGVFQVTSMCAR